MIDNDKYYHRKPNIGYDILPECNYKGVIKGNYLSQWLDYKNRIIEFLTNYDWKSQFKSISAIRIKNYHN